MFHIRAADDSDYSSVLEFYDTLIDSFRNMEYAPGWEKNVYPTKEYLREAIEKGELYIGELGGNIASCMVVNHRYNEGYNAVRWSVEVADAELYVIHILGVLPEYSRKGMAKQMVGKVIEMARKNNIRTIRLDVLEGNIPAERAYTKMGFKYVDTVKMFYEDTGWTEFRLYEFIL